MAKKVYKHNDYYGYINKIQEKAISNSDWFWSDAEPILKHPEGFVLSNIINDD